MSCAAVSTVLPLARSAGWSLGEVLSMVAFSLSSVSSDSGDAEEP
jgi:hypothetical protein